MPQRNLIWHYFWYIAHLGELVDALLFLGLLVVHLLNTEVDALALVVVLINLEHVQIKGNCELGVGPCAGKHVADNLGLVDLENVPQAYDLAAGG